MAAVVNHHVDVRGCPATVRFAVADADTWVAVLLARIGPATRIAINIEGGGKISHAEVPGVAVKAEDDFHPIADGQSYYFELNPNKPPPTLQVAGNADGAFVSVHVTSSPLACGCRR